MVVLVTCKNEEDPIKNEGARVLTSSYIDFRRSRAANSAVSGVIPPKFKLIQALMIVLFTCKNEEDPIKNEGTRVLSQALEGDPSKPNICLFGRKSLPTLVGFSFQSVFLPKVGRCYLP